MLNRLVARARPFMATAWLAAERRWGFRCRRGFGQVLEHDLRALLPNPGVVIDVGANRGQFALSVLRTQPAAFVYSLEPADDAFEVLERRALASGRISAHRMAVSTEQGQAILHRAQSDTGSSLLQADSRVDHAWTRQIGTQVVRTVRLDDFCAQQDIRSIALLKSDTQGHEAAVLQSAGGMLRPERVSAVVVEVNFDQFYRGQSQPHEIFGILETRGFRMVALYPHRDPEGRVAWADVAFLAA